MERFSLVSSAVIFYGGLGILFAYETGDYLWGYYGLMLSIFSGLYHYYDERRYFGEDFICSFFFKLHLTTNYVWWLSWGEIFYYMIFSELIGYGLFYLSFVSWRRKSVKYGYMISHNIWHIYTGGMAYMVGKKEKRVNIGDWDLYYMLIFVLLITSNNLRGKFGIKCLIYLSAYLFKKAVFDGLK